MRPDLFVKALVLTVQGERIELIRYLGAGKWQARKNDKTFTIKQQHIRQGFYK